MCSKSANWDLQPKLLPARIIGLRGAKDGYAYEGKGARVYFTRINGHIKVEILDTGRIAD